MRLLPASAFNESYAVPYWTLVYEMAFYAVMYACVVFRRSRAQIATVLDAWAAMIILACQSNIHPAFQNDIVDAEQFVSRCAGVTPSRRWQC
ncbi:hypothetical protein [Paraburkholderia sediminicola]|uniref:hypothetical protein n=1 Tax=Paraburkholderia sediminicola TaxID=458836 RepID=UPI0038B99221